MKLAPFILCLLDYSLAGQVANRIAPGEKKINAKDGLAYLWVPPGTFMMGCSQTDESPAVQPARRQGPPPFRGLTNCWPDEKPLHDVVFSNGFWMGQIEVTVDAYTRFANATGKSVPSEKDPFGAKINSTGNDPMVLADWYGAADYCSWAGMSLPTEAQWEYAVNQRRYLDNGPKPVRWDPQALVIDFGDLSGRRSEWTADWYAADYYSVSGLADPKGPPQGDRRVVRGGSDGLNPGGVRLSARRSEIPATRGRGIAFRCAGQSGSLR